MVPFGFRRAVWGNAYEGETVERTVRVDGEPPFVNVRIGCTQISPDKERTVPVTVMADDGTGVETIEVSINGADYVGYDGPLVLDATQDQNLVIRAIDVMDNISPKRKIEIEGTH